MKRSELRRTTPLKSARGGNAHLRPKVCDQCGVEYQPTAGPQKHCSRACAAKAILVERVCEHCGGKYMRVGSRGGRFCSQTCSNRHTATRRAARGSAVLPRLEPCPNCGAMFMRDRKRKSCSRTCAATARHARARALAPPKWGVAAKGEESCRNCGRPASHLHHIAPRSKSKKAAAEIQRNGMPLCFQCHRGWHDRLVTISQDKLSDEEFAYVIAIVGSAWFERNYPEHPLSQLLTLYHTRSGRWLDRDPGVPEPMRVRTERLLGVEWLAEGSVR